MKDTGIERIFSDYLRRNQDLVLQDWKRRLTEAEPQGPAASLLPAEILDAIPELLANVRAGLRGGEGAGDAVKEDAAGHGQLRWQQGFMLRDMFLEWRFLIGAIDNALIAFAEGHEHFDAVSVLRLRSLLGDLLLDSVLSSVDQYERMRQVEAQAHLQDLRQAMSTLRYLDTLRRDFIRESAHDLRGNVNMMLSLSNWLRSDSSDVSSAVVDSLIKGLEITRQIVEEMTRLARLEAGEDPVQLGRTDVTPVLTSMCEACLPLASEKGLKLTWNGPSRFDVMTDVSKVARLTQNLLLNALKYTPKGAVAVEWGLIEPDRWEVRISDTGPGLAARSPELGEAFAIDASRENGGTRGPLNTRRPRALPWKSGSQAAAVPRPPTSLDWPGEGIGLSVVKRLCELLGATLSMSESGGSGLQARVQLPLKPIRPKARPAAPQQAEEA